MEWPIGWRIVIYIQNITCPGLKILVSDTSDKMSSVFTLGSDIFEMMSDGLGFSLW